VKRYELPEEELRKLLRGLRVEPPEPEGFAHRLRDGLREAGPPARPSLLARWRALWQERPPVFSGTFSGITGVVTGATAFALLVMLQGVPGPPLSRVTGPTASAPASVAPEAAEAVHRVPTDKIAVIRLNFNTAVAVDDVTFEVRLPEGLSFWSDGKKLADRSYRWRGNLTAGDNPLPVAVHGARPGRYRVVATADMDGNHVEHALVLEVFGA
jgi:hypothetical protein